MCTTHATLTILSYPFDKVDSDSLSDTLASIITELDARLSYTQVCSKMYILHQCSEAGAVVFVED